MADSGGGENHNKKAPGLAVEDNPPTTHYNYHVTAGPTGKLSVSYDDEDDPQRSFKFDLDDNGSYKGSQAKGTGLVTTLTAAQERKYCSKGSGTHADGNIECSTNGNQSTVAKKDVGEQAGGSKLEGNQKKIGGSKEGDVSISHDNQTNIIKGNNRLFVEKNNNIRVDVNQVTTIGGLSHQNNKGDYGLFIEKGTYDAKVETGKYRIDAAKNISILSHDQINLSAEEGTGFINLKALNKITFTVGDSSITIEPSKITIKSAAIEFKQ